MSDNVDTYAGPTAWWEGISPTVRERTILNADLRWEEMAPAAGLVWDAVKFPAHDEKGPIPGWCSVRRSDTDGYLGLVKPSYHLFQSTDLGKLGDDILDSSGAHWHTAGALDYGRIIWGLAKFDKDLYVKGDDSPIEDYLLLTTGHDGRHALTGASTQVLVVCKNTQTAALKGSVNKFTVKHTGGMPVRIGDARKALDMHFKYREDLIAVLNDLTTRKLDLPGFIDFTEALIPDAEGVANPYKTRGERERLATLWKSEDTVTRLPDTAYKAYQAVTFYTDHDRTYKSTKAIGASDRRAIAIIEGDAATTKDRALALLRTA